MLRQAFRKLRIFLKLERPGCQIVSKEVAEFLDVQVKQPNPGFMGQGPQEKDVGHSACRKAAQLGFYTDPNASVGQVTQNPWQGNRPLQHRAIPNGVQPYGLYDDRIIPGGGENIGMVGAPSRLTFPLTPEEVEYFRDYYYRVFGVDPEVFNKFVQEHQKEGVEIIVDSVRDAFYGRTKPTAIGPEPGFDLRGNRIMPLPTEPEVLEAYLRDKLTPQLVVDNVGATTDTRTYGEEPDLLDPAHIRKLSMGWVMWCSGFYNLTPKQAWEVGAKSMIDSEFDGKMRGNVEILPWEPTDPCKVKIKYHDKVLNPDDPWFAEEE